MQGVRVHGVSKRYGSRVVLDEVRLEAAPGALVLVAGRSGSGKSTLLSIIAGLEVPSAGRVEVAGRDLAGMDADAVRAHRLHHVGIVFQDFRLIPDLSVAENVRLPLTLAGVRRPQERVARLLDEVGLAGRAAAFPESLSGGEQQRVAVARALANDPAVVLADEPTANLDDENAQRVMTMLARIAAGGRTVLVASHDPIAAPFAGPRWRIVAGRLRPFDERVQRPAVLGAE